MLTKQRAARLKHKWREGDRVWVPSTKPGKKWSGDIGALFDGGCLVAVDGVPGPHWPYLYTELRRNTWGVPAPEGELQAPQTLRKRRK